MKMGYFLGSKWHYKWLWKFRLTTVHGNLEAAQKTAGNGRIVVDVEKLGC